MSTLGVAEKDFHDAVRSRMVRGLTAVFTLVSVLGVSLYALSGAETATTADAVAALALPSMLIVPLAALVVGYMSIVGERESGSLKLLLGFPVSRRAFVSGKLLGRVAVVGLAVAVAFAVSGGVAFALYGDVPVADYAALALATVGMGLAFTGLAVGISSSVRSRGRALAGSVGAYFALVLFWQPLVVCVHYLVTGSVPGLEVPGWFLLLERLSPVGAYQVLVGTALDTDVAVSLFRVRPPETATMSVAEQLGGAVPVYLADWTAGPFLALWVVVPTVLGYLRFDRCDL